MLILEQLVANPEEVLEPFTWIILVLSLAALVLELVGIIQASRDERIFLKASNGMVLALLLSFAVLFIGEGELLRTALELLTIVPTIYCSVTVIHAIMHGERYETLHAILHTMILTMELVEVSIFLGCTGQAERMLHHGAHAEEA